MQGAGGKSRRNRPKAAARRAEEAKGGPKVRKAKAPAQGTKKQARASTAGASAGGAGRKTKRQRAPKADRRRPPKADRRRAPKAESEAQQARAAVFEEMRELVPYLGVSAAGADFIVSTGDTHVGRGLFTKRQRPEMGVLRRAVHLVEGFAGHDALAGSLFVDVGANIGTTTVAALVTHRFGAAVAFEPDEANYRLLRANLAINGLEERAQALCLGLSNRTGRSRLVVVEGSSGKSWVALDEAPIGPNDASGPADAAGTAVVDIELTTLDRLVEEGTVDSEGVGMLWVDAESHEGHVLEGARTLAARGVPIVLEFHPAGIDERGDRGKIHAVADEWYTHFVDVRRPPSKKGQPQLVPRPVAELPGYAERFLSDSTPEIFTDLLLLRLTTEQVRSGPEI